MRGAKMGVWLATTLMIVMTVGCGGGGGGGGVVPSATAGGGSAPPSATQKQSSTELVVPDGFSFNVEAGIVKKVSVDIGVPAGYPDTVVSIYNTGQTPLYDAGGAFLEPGELVLLTMGRVDSTGHFTDSSVAVPIANTTVHVVAVMGNTGSTVGDMREIDVTIDAANRVVLHF